MRTLKTLPLAAGLCMTALFSASAQQAAPQPTANVSAPASRLVGYFPEWGVYNNFFVKNVVTSGSAKLLTQIDYAFASLQNNQCTLADPWADYQQPLPASETVNGVADPGTAGVLAGNFHQLEELKRRYPKLKVAISIGGGSANPALFSVAAQPANRAQFVKSCIDLFVRGKFGPGVHAPGIFDGFDIDWEYPASAEDKENFTALLAEFRSQMNAIRPGMVLSIAAPAGSWAYQYIDMKGVEPSLDFVGLMAYDFDGPWSKTTGLVAPASQAAGDPSPTNNAAAAVWAYYNGGVPASKIVLGVPFYGYEWTDVPNVNHGLFQPGTPVGQGSGYNQIVPIEGSFTTYRDPQTLSPWLYDGKTFWTYDDPYSLGYKALAARALGLGGVMAWSLSGDTADGVLLKTIALELNTPQ